MRAMTTGVVAVLMFAALSLSAVPSSANWSETCRNVKPSCVSYTITPAGNSITVSNNCNEEVAVVPVRGSTQHWPKMIIAADAQSTRTGPSHWSSYTDVWCCARTHGRRHLCGRVID